MLQFYNAFFFNNKKPQIKLYGVILNLHFPLKIGAKQLQAFFFTFSPFFYTKITLSPKITLIQLTRLFGKSSRDMLIRTSTRIVDTESSKH